MAGRSVNEMRRELTVMLAGVFEDDYVDRWFELAHHAFDGRTPLSMLEEDGEDGFQVIARLIEAVKQGVYL